MVFSAWDGVVVQVTQAHTRASDLSMGHGVFEVWPVRCKLPILRGRVMGAGGWRQMPYLKGALSLSLTMATTSHTVSCAEGV